MFAIAILIGIFSYGIFLLGLLGVLYPTVILIFSALFFAGAIYLQRTSIGEIKDMREEAKQSIFCRFLLFFLIAQGLINLIGALGPEHGFDALWYHLTLPKLYLFYHSIVHIPGGVLYYSDMPKLTEMLYVAGLALGNETTAKLGHFLFGILTTIAVYKMGRMYLSIRYSLLACAIFYSNLVVGWMSTTAYVDLARTFFEALALWCFLIWVKTGVRKWLLESSVMLGLAITTKLLASGSVVIFSLLLLVVVYLKRWPIKRSYLQIVLYILVSFVIPLPWFVFSFLHTGNPVFPFFTRVYGVAFNMNLLAPQVFLGEIWQLFTHLADPITPVYIISLPLLFFCYRRFSTSGRIILFYSFLALLIWYITPRTGGGRFILPYLPAFSLITAFIIKEIYTTLFPYKKLAISFANIVIVLVLLISLVYRGMANSKYIPVLLGRETKAEFLTKQLNFSFGDFYDIDSYFKKTIKKEDRVLLYGFHNLYYVDFPFIDSSFVQKGNTFNYIAIQNGELPERFRYWSLIYSNPITNVRLYTFNKKWIY